MAAVVLGGSRARGTHRPDSDYDLGSLLPRRPRRRGAENAGRGRDRRGHRGHRAAVAGARGWTAVAG
ncbi:nucleotidyltransferase domain-containing protein [Catenuloplanes niger]